MTHATAGAAATGLPEEPMNLLAACDELGSIRDLVDAAFMAASSLAPGLGREPLTRLLDLIVDKIGDVQKNLDGIRQAENKAT
jgi:hypothetical protein